MGPSDGDGKTECMTSERYQAEWEKTIPLKLPECQGNGRDHSLEDGRHAYPSLLECHPVVSGRPSF